MNPPLRVKAGSFLNDAAYSARYIELAARKARLHPSGLILVLLDCEDECPGVLGPQLLQRVRLVGTDVTSLVVLAYREYETWFLAAARSLRNCARLPPDLEPPPTAEAIRGAKEWLSRKMAGGYNELTNQAHFTDDFAFNEAMSVHSFARFRSRMRIFFGEGPKTGNRQ